ncbi:MAG: dipeptidase [Nakamurella sp.]
MTLAQTDKISEILSAAPIFDGHNDLAWALRDLCHYDLDVVDISQDQPTLHTDISRLRAGGVGAQFFSVFVPSTLGGAGAVVATLEQVDCVRRIIARYPETFVAARTASDVRRAWSSGRIAALMGAEGGHSIAGSLAVLRTLRALGVAYMTLTHNENNPWADSATDVPAAGGLTDFGRDVVREMNRVGMLVDLSHVAPSTMHDALATSTAPVVFSHSSCRALTDHVRDVPDDVLAQLPGNGGVIMLTFVPAFVSQHCADHSANELTERQRLNLGVYAYDNDAGKDPAAVAELSRWQAAHPAPTATISDVADHIDHAREVAGVNHIGLGGDYDGVPALPTGLEDVSRYPAVLVELADRGWADTDIAALTSGNIMRVLQNAEDAADPGFGA